MKMESDLFFIQTVLKEKLEPEKNKESDFIKFKSDPLIYWKQFFRVAYYVGVVPFHFKQDPQNGVYSIHTNSIQKVIYRARVYVSLVRSKFQIRQAKYLTQYFKSLGNLKCSEFWGFYRFA